MVACALTAAPAQAATPTVTNFSAGMPAGTVLAQDITASPDGRVWFTTQFPRTLSAADMSGSIATPTVIDTNIDAEPYGITAGSDALLYYALAQPSGPSAPPGSYVGVANPANGLANEQWYGGGTPAQPQYPVTAPDGLIRVTQSGSSGNANASAIGKIALSAGGTNPAAPGILAQTTTPTAGAIPQKIVAGPSDTSANPTPALWFVEFATGRIGRVTEISGGGGDPTDFVEEYALLPANGPQDIELGPDGNLWITLYAQNKVARVTPPSTFSGIPTVTTFDLPAGGTNILGIAAGPDNNMWVAQETGNKIVRMNLSGQVTGQYPVTFPRFITTAADGNLWFTANNDPRVARITTALDPPEHRNTAPIDIPLGSPSGPNLSSPITVTGEPGFITDVNVRVTGISHTFPDDLDLILEPPNGQPIMLASDVGSAVGSRVSPISAKRSYPANGITLSFDDASPFSLRDRMPLVSGIYKPTNIADPVGGDLDGGNPAPSGPFATFMGSQQGFGAEGTWRLWVFDDGSTSQDNLGKVFGGWGLDIETEVDLTVTKAGTGSGTVTSAPAGISCGDTCESFFPANTQVTLTATPSADSAFASWTGCTSTSGDQCTVSMSSDKAVTASFAANPVTQPPIGSPPPVGTPPPDVTPPTQTKKCKKKKGKKAGAAKKCKKKRKK